MFDESAARIFASIDAPLSAAGSRLPAEDLMIAATALANGHEVVTRDLRSRKATSHHQQSPRKRKSPVSTGR
jgi:predicted nucleic acid-binding protein